MAGLLNWTIGEIERSRFKITRTTCQTVNETLFLKLNALSQMGKDYLFDKVLFNGVSAEK